MLTGNLPFNDDSSNPDGDNINLLYKYIVNTPLSFPDYVSPEARDLLSMMLVPDPTRRADLRSIMAHPWLAAYAHNFSKAVEDLERVAMEQHQMKRFAYQGQMQQAAASASQQEPARVARTQSARVDGMLGVSGVTASGTGAAAVAAAAAQPRSHSFTDNTQPHPEYLYETSLIDQSIYSSPSPPTHPPNASSRHPASLAVSPTSPIDDDPFAPPPSVSIPVTISTPDNAPASVVPVKDAHSTADTTAAGTAAAQPDQKQKDPSGFRHTVQVEYPGEPRAPEPSPPALGTAKPPPSSLLPLLLLLVLRLLPRERRRTRRHQHLGAAQRQLRRCAIASRHRPWVAFLRVPLALPLWRSGSGLSRHRNGLSMYTFGWGRSAQTMAMDSRRRAFCQRMRSSTRNHFR